MKNFLKNNYKFISVVSFLLIFSILLTGKGIKHKKVEYNFFVNLSKTNSLNFLSEVIEVPIEKPEPFIAIGLSAILNVNSSNIEFYIRSSVDKQNWGNWELISKEENSKIGDEEYISALSFFKKECKFIQFRTNKISHFSKLTFSFISPGKTSKLQVEENIKHSHLSKTLDGVERPAFVTRKGWGCPQDEHVSSRTLTNVTHLIIHHSAGSTVSNDYAAVVRSYWDYHVNGHGWDDIGYNWLVDPQGVLYKGRAWKSSTQENVMGAHNTGRNGNTVGICFIGNYMSNTPSEVGLNKLAGISAFLCDKYNINPLGKSYHAAISHTNDNITGHGQSGGVYGSHSTSCPGTQIINRMQSIREVTYSKIIDTTAVPEVALTYPDANVDSTYLTKKVFIEFSKPMNKASVENAFSVDPEVSLIKTWNEQGNIIYFEPSPAFEKLTSYTITISNTATSKWNVPLTENVELRFVTKLFDNLSLIETYPQNGDVDIATDVFIEIKFDGPINGNSLSGNVFFLDDSSKSVPITVYQSGYKDGIIKFKSKSPLDENSTYSIQLKEGITTTDNYTFVENRTIYFTTKSITSVYSKNTPSEFKLEQNYPNPFNPSTSIKYSIPPLETLHSTTQQVQLKVYDILGKEVTTLVDENKLPGVYEVIFDSNNISGGVYYYQLRFNDYLETKSMILLK